jgi:membrane protease subunit (stomatin/prohibitin family)
MGAIGGNLADQWLEFFICESLEANVLAAKGQKKTSKRSSNTKGEDNIISDGSGIVVNKGQAAMVVDNGRIVEFCAEEGHYTYQWGEPSLFTGSLDKSIIGTIKSIGDRIKHGGITGKDQRIYYFNTKEIMGNKYGTPNPIPYLVTDPSINFRQTISLRANGEYSFRMINPALFYANVCGNVEDRYTTDIFDSQLTSEIITVLGPSLGKLGTGLEYHEISFQTEKLAELLNEALSSKWREGRGIEIVNFGITCTASPEDEKRLKDLQTSAVARDPTMAGAMLVSAQSDAMRTAAGNTAGAMTGFMGMGMANQAGGMNPQALFQMGQAAQQQPAAPQAAGAAAAGWTCICGNTGNTGKFCAECGSPAPAPATSWTCSCGHAGNTGKFCAECGKPAPASALADAAWTCSCGHAGNTGKFCAECGKPRP